jgi:hypothetical protein
VTKVEYCQKRIDRLGDRAATRDDLLSVHEVMMNRYSIRSMSVLGCLPNPNDQANYCLSPKFLYYTARDVFHFFLVEEVHCVRLESGKILMDRHEAGKCPYYEYPDREPRGQ